MTLLVAREWELGERMTELLEEFQNCSGFFIRRTNLYSQKQIDRRLWLFQNPNAEFPLPKKIAQRLEMSPTQKNNHQ
jgi:hypothetical protein